MGDSLTLLVSTSISMAQIITTRLDNIGIECYFKNFNFLGQTPESGIDILVKESDYTKSHQIIQELQLEMANDTLQSKEDLTFPDLFIVPVDYSRASCNACIYTIELASLLKARVKLIHTYGLPEIRPMSFDDTDFFSGTLSQHISEVRQDAEKRMNELQTNLNNYCVEKNLGTIPILTSIVNGLPDEITIYSAESENAGLIIMGISNKEVRTFEPIGKISSKILEKANVPVLIIPEDSEFKGIETLKNVLYITAFDESDFPAIQKLFKIVEKLNAHIYFLHISNDERDSWDKIKMEGLKEYFKKAYNKTNVSCELIVSENILESLDKFIQEKKIDMISNISHKRNLISKLINPSITLKILYHTQIPLLVFHH